MFFNRKKKNTNVEKIPLKPLNYPAKVIAVWGEAISGKEEFLEVLMKSEYKELGLFVYALHHKKDARNWLMKNGYPHFLALINGVERNQEALGWLKKHNFNILYHMALCGDGDEDSFKWLMKNNHRDMAMIAKKIEFVKNEIEQNNNDVHRISPE